MDSCNAESNKENTAESVQKQPAGKIRFGDRKLPLITIIVPVYNVRAYVGECIESLLRQTYTNLEIILVDDGSTDGSGELCDEYARKDNRIQVIHQENQGLSGARNTGLDYVGGKYVAFVDSDDAVSAFYIERLYQLTEKYHADIAVCAYVREPEKRRKSSLIRWNSFKNRYKNFNEINPELKNDTSVINNTNRTNDTNITTFCMPSEQMLRQWHGKYKRYETVAWNKLYRMNVLNDNSNNRKIRFPQGRKHEDVLTSHLIVENANRIALTTQALYHYRSREGSITARTVSGEGMEENLRAQRERMAFFWKERYFRACLNLLTGYVLHWLWFRWKIWFP